MERRQGARAQVDVVVSAYVDGQWHRCRAIDLSATGMVVERPPALVDRLFTSTTRFELRLDSGRPIRLRGRPVWDRGRLLAVRFVLMNDVDRLTIAELVDQKGVVSKCA